MERAINWQITGSAFTPRCYADAKACLPPVDAAIALLDPFCRRCASCAWRAVQIPGWEWVAIEAQHHRVGPRCSLYMTQIRFTGLCVLRTSSTIFHDVVVALAQIAEAGASAQRLLTMHRSVKGISIGIPQQQCPEQRASNPWFWATL
ncbi:hypothetical protein BP5796_08247 [Coleophoma crateriformis]|uniref:Uncharacterized protein n=1 Tax=Coleophoma crateriformis TaxID=565419 RepID=A0A3D8RDS1_9HELO|nr:hypothetical protein BP5796_08247 [Coleophoma crateriformis]